MIGDREIWYLFSVLGFSDVYAPQILASLWRVAIWPTQFCRMCRRPEVVSREKASHLLTSSLST